MAKRLTFVLPGSSGSPTGGARIVYEYANRLAARGHVVNVVHSPVTRIDPSWKMLAKALFRYPQRWIDRSYRPDSWMTVDPGVNVYWVPLLHGRYIPDADIVIATAWKTAEWVARYGESKGSKYYFIQGFEDWDASRERVEATWKLPLRKLVIARWLQQMAAKLSESVTHVPNAIDGQQFFCEVPPSARDEARVAMLYHAHKLKGCDVGLAALQQVKETYPKLRVELFGIPSCPQNLPDWIQYHRNPRQSELRAIYNRAAIYLAPSWNEGWGLTALEAAACGAALVATDIDGYREFAVPDFNALMSPVGVPEGLAKNLLRLLGDSKLRESIARKGMDTACEFNWTHSVEVFEHAIQH